MEQAFNWGVWPMIVGSKGEVSSKPYLQLKTLTHVCVYQLISSSYSELIPAALLVHSASNLSPLTSHPK